MTDANNAILDQFTYTLRADGLRESVLEHRLTQATPSGQQPSFSDTTISWDYDEDGRLKSEFHDEGAASTDGHPNDAGDYLDTYAYDLNGNRMTKGHVFYDGSGSHAQTTEYEYDSGGDDRLMSESTVDEDNQPITSTTYSYDDNGSQIEKQTTTSWNYLSMASGMVCALHSDSHKHIERIGLDARRICEAHAEWFGSPIIHAWFEILDEETFSRFANANNTVMVLSGITDKTFCQTALDEFESVANDPLRFVVRDKTAGAAIYIPQTEYERYEIYMRREWDDTLPKILELLRNEPFYKLKCLF